MAKQRKNTITASLKKEGKELDLEKMKKQVAQLHASEEKKVEEEAPRKVRLSVDVPEDVYLSMKGKVLRERTTIKKYALELIKKDLGF